MTDELHKRRVLILFKQQQLVLLRDMRSTLLNGTKSNITAKFTAECLKLKIVKVDKESRKSKF
jgi:hypothetical protein